MTQKELAELLFVTESAVSKWERGVSYPDISLVSDICGVLEITEHELVTASEDVRQREIERQALKFRHMVKRIRLGLLYSVRSRAAGVPDYKPCGRSQAVLVFIVLTAVLTAFFH